MRIGLISKPEHCRPHVKAIKALGVKVEVLGGDPGLSIPRRVDAVVVRTCSISHAAFNVAKAWERDGGTAFFVEGANKAAQAVQEIMVETSIDKVSKVMKEVSWMHWHLLLSLSDEARVQIGVGHINGAVPQFAGMAPSTVRGAITKASEKLGWTRTHRAVNTGSGRPVTIHVSPRPHNKEREQQVDLFVKAIHAMQAPNVKTEPVDILEVRKQINEQQAQEAKAEAKNLNADKVVVEVKSQCDSNTHAVLEVMDEQKAQRERHDLLLVTTCELAERILVLEEGTGPAKDYTANPFMVIEDFKRKLAASGFRGTLTLEIS